jgi:hypothetical protein
MEDNRPRTTAVSAGSVRERCTRADSCTAANSITRSPYRRDRAARPGPHDPQRPLRVPRRNLEAADYRDGRADPGEAGTQGASRLRIRTQWRRQSVHGVRAAGRVAACESDRPPTAIDAHTLRDLSDVHFPDAAKIVLVQDNLNTHKPAALYEAFPAAEARRLVERFEWPPKRPRRQFRLSSTSEAIRSRWASSQPLAILERASPA